MKNIIKMLNNLNKSHTDTLQEQLIKNDGLTAMFKNIKESGGDIFITYKPGKGYIFKPLKKLDTHKAKKAIKLSEKNN